MPSNSLSKKPRNVAEARILSKSIIADFPALSNQPEIVEAICYWEEFYIGVLDDTMDSETYDSFSLFPVEELYARTEWKETGWIAVAYFYICGQETNLCISANTSDQRLHIWLRDREGAEPQPVSVKLPDILASMESHPDHLPEQLAQLVRDE